MRHVMNEEDGADIGTGLLSHDGRAHNDRNSLAPRRQERCSLGLRTGWKVERGVKRGGQGLACSFVYEPKEFINALPTSIVACHSDGFFRRTIDVGDNAGLICHEQAGADTGESNLLEEW